MKENIVFFSHVLDNQLAVENACRSFKGQLAKKGQSLALFIKKHVFTGLTTCGIGVILYVAILLFLQQLAEYGW